MTKFVLGIETSCDETAAAIVCDEGRGTERIVSNIVRTQVEEHADYGGVVPELAARAHADLILPIIQQAFHAANLVPEKIDAIAATCGPGLMGGVLIGMIAAKTLALVHQKPFIAVNHLEGHAQVCCLTDDVEFPYLLLLVSGGHCQFLEVYGLNHYRLLGETLDDSAGEAFDKIAHFLGLPYPGGPQIERMALEGDPERFKMPLPLKGRPGCDLSFSGLKTAFRILIQKMAPPSEQDINDISACLQKGIADSLIDRAKNAFAMMAPEIRQSRRFVLTGGVAANKIIQKRFKDFFEERGFQIFSPPLSLCMDNAAMIAWVGLKYHLQNIHHDFSFSANPRWKLTERRREDREPKEERSVV
ncbi:tRNA N6-adenosine threonylcarbamoyltransferase [Alphaproteobacteria bacterium]|nr:tRNA N6-adenosine threonylcarbamoyltransferase [Alphaproteobacteria bacterium]GHS95883.1 tRNA N6-adenosine threonylcarbamoyltransferase [Alphaproteobacteria bacterium]